MKFGMIEYKAIHKPFKNWLKQLNVFLLAFPTGIPIGVLLSADIYFVQQAFMINSDDILSKYFKHCNMR